MPLAERSGDERLALARELLAAGDVAGARAAADALLASEPSGVLALELVLLDARVALHEGDPVGALRAVEEARARFPGEGRVAATEAEILAATGRLVAAEESYRRGLLESGALPDLERTRGVLRICSPGLAQPGLDALLRAAVQDPSVPYLERPTAQARLLVGRAALADSPSVALAHAEAGLALAPHDFELAELAAEAHAALHEFDRALELYAELDARPDRPPTAGGSEPRSLADTRALLHHKAATAELLPGGDRERAVEHYLAARALGLDDEGLGFGTIVLSDEARAAVEAGWTALEAGDDALAARGFERALELEPRNLEALQFLGVARFHVEDFPGAAEVWGRLLERARVEGLTLPDPVALNLARAWRLAGEPARARSVLEEELARDPDGPHVADVREMLARLEDGR